MNANDKASSKSDPSKERECEFRDLTKEEATSPEESPPDSTDPALVAATILLKQLVEKPVGTAKISPTDLIIIEVPGFDWIDPVSKAAPVVFFKEKHDSVGRPRFRRRDYDSPIAIIAREPEKVAGLASDTIERQVSDALADGKPVIVVTSDPETSVPAHIRKSADHHFVMQTLDAWSLGEFLTITTGSQATAQLTDLKAELINPKILRLAYRRGQDADACVDRLAKGIEQSSSLKTQSRLGLSQLAGMPEVVAWAQTLAIDIAEYRAGRIQWSDVDRGALLCGPPGTGKTSAAHAIADYCRIPFIATSYAQWQAAGEGHLGDVTRAMRQTFGLARKKAPAILFLDELDSVGSRQRSKHDEWWSNIVNALLELLDGTADREGVIVIGATNHASKIDAAIRRAGRLDREIEIRLPNLEALREIFTVYLGTSLRTDELVRLASLAVGKTGADIALWARGARRRARLEARPVVYEDVLHEIFGEKRKNNALTWRVAVHEAGHSLVLMLQNPRSPPSVSIKNLGEMRGETISMQHSNIALTPTALDRHLVSLLAGRAAEEVFFAEISAGAGGARTSDLAKATALAVMAEATSGMGASGLLWTSVEDLDRINHLLVTRPLLEKAVRARLDSAYARAKWTIEGNRKAVRRLAEALLDETVLSPERVAKIVSDAIFSECMQEFSVGRNTVH